MASLQQGHLAFLSVAFVMHPRQNTFPQQVACWGSSKIPKQIPHNRLAGGSAINWQGTLLYSREKVRGGATILH